jgi:hypothetical protein
VRLGDLQPGRYRPLTPREERALYQAIHLDPENPETDTKERASGKPKRPRRRTSP